MPFYLFINFNFLLFIHTILVDIDGEIKLKLESFLLLFTFDGGVLGGIADDAYFICYSFIQKIK